MRKFLPVLLLVIAVLSACQKEVANLKNEGGKQQINKEVTTSVKELDDLESEQVKINTDSITQEAEEDLGGIETLTKDIQEVNTLSNDDELFNQLTDLEKLDNSLN